MAETVTTLKFMGFSIEVKEGPVELLMQTDKGPVNFPSSFTLSVSYCTPRAAEKEAGEKAVGDARFACFNQEAKA
jgi:hypothetical protein